MTATCSTPSFRRVDDRGEFIEVIAEGTWEAVLCGTMRAGAVLGNHYHRHTRIYFYLRSGSAEVGVVDVATEKRTQSKLAAGQGAFLEAGQAHAIRFTEPSDFIMAKSHRYDPENPDTYPFPVDPAADHS